jgi:cellulose biosynthesis protein BcsQ
MALGRWQRRALPSPILAGIVKALQPLASSGPFGGEHPPMSASRQTKIIAVANMKGGVGKTTVVVSLAETLAAGGGPGGLRQVLVIDLDPQANASFSLAGDEVLLDLIQGGRTVDAFLEDRILFNQDRSLRELIQANVGAAGDKAGEGGVSLIASSPELRLVEREVLVFLSRGDDDLDGIEHRMTAAFREELNALKGAYDIIIIDCAPGISAITEAALWACDLIIVPTVPDFISNLGLEAFCRSVLTSETAGGVPRKPKVLANRVQGGPMQDSLLAELRAESAAEDGGFLMFATEIPDCPDLEDATNWPGARTPYGLKYGADTAAILRKLAAEL